MNNKAFTLIELLALIVIFVITLIIATPIILHITRNFKDSATKRSAETYMDALNLSITIRLTKDKNIRNGIYEISNDGDLCLGKLTNDVCGSELVQVELDGSKPREGIVIIENAMPVFAYLVIGNTGTVVSATEDELIANASFEYDGSYYLFENDLKQLNALSSDNVTGYLIYKDGKIKEYNINIGAERHDTYDKEELEIVKVSDYGAKGDGVTDDYEAIKKAVDYINANGGRLLFDKNKTYLVSTPSGNIASNLSAGATIDLKTQKKVIIDLNGSTLKLKANNFLRYNIIKVVNCTDLIIQNGKIIGDRIEHDYETQYSKITSSGATANYRAVGYGIYITSSSFEENSNVIVRDMEISYTTGDGIVSSLKTSGLEKYGKGLTIIDNVEIHRNKRQGITLAENDKVIIKDVYIHHIGDLPEEEWIDLKGEYKSQFVPSEITSDLSRVDIGQMPKSGIDIEPEVGLKTTHDVIFDNLRIEDTSGYAVVVGQDYFINNFKIYNSKLYGSYYLRKSKSYNNYFESNTGLGIMHYSYVYNSKFINKYVGFNFNNTNIYNSIIESNSSHSSQKINISNSNLYSTSIKDSRISITNSNNSINNIYENSLIQIRLNRYNEQDSIFKNSDLELFNSDDTLYDAFTLNKLNFENVTIYRRYYNIHYLNINESRLNNVTFMNYVKLYPFSKITFINSEINNLLFKYNPDSKLNNYKSLVFNNSKVNNVETDMQLPISIINSEFILNDINNALIANSNFNCNNSNITINNSILSSTVFSDSKFTNNCVINLNKYNNNKPLQLSSSSSVTINYNGNEYLEN